MVLLLLFVENIWQDGAMMLGRFPMTFILWPLNYEKLQALKQLIQKQLEHKHIEPSFSPWNSPVFVIKKKIWKMETSYRFRKCKCIFGNYGSFTTWIAYSYMYS
jgi:hypothetical protein